MKKTECKGRDKVVLTRPRPSIKLTIYIQCIEPRLKLAKSYYTNFWLFMRVTKQDILQEQGKH